jgi:putative colanic acid biosynthesis UDP-glucose lipid carrier transferase
MRSNEHFVSLVQRVTDALLVILAQYLAYLAYNEPWQASTTLATAIGLITFGFAAEFAGLYRPWRMESLTRELRETLLTWIAVPVVLLSYTFVTKTSADYSRGATILWLVFAPSLLVSLRLTVRALLRLLRARGINIRRVAILGSTPEAEKLAAAFDARPWLGFKLIGLFEDRSEDCHYKIDRPDCKLLGGRDQLVKLAHEGSVDIVYVTLPIRSENLNAHLFHELADTTITVYMVVGLLSYNLLSAHWSHVGDVPVVSIHDTPFKGMVAWLKRLEDLLVGSMILSVIALPMLAIAFAIKMTSKGPVIFRQLRYGLNGKRISVLKFRTMIVSEETAEVQQATFNDPRVTPLGRFLRRTSMDELPQFFQVMTGELSIVGPRPHAVAHNEQYRSLIEGYMLRHMVKPGITGWAQVNGWRGETIKIEKMQKRVQHDLEYIRNWSLLWDIKIIFLTVFGRKKNRNAF